MNTRHRISAHPPNPPFQPTREEAWRVHSGSFRAGGLNGVVRPLMPEQAVCPSFGGQRKVVAARESRKAWVCCCAGRRLGFGQRSRCSPAEVAPHATAYRPSPQARRDGTARKAVARKACTGAGIGSSSWRHS